MVTLVKSEQNKREIQSRKTKIAMDFNKITQTLIGSTITSEMMDAELEHERIARDEARLKFYSEIEKAIIKCRIPSLKPFEGLLKTWGSSLCQAAIAEEEAAFGNEKWLTTIRDSFFAFGFPVEWNKIVEFALQPLLIGVFSKKKIRMDLFCQEIGEEIEECLRLYFIRQVVGEKTFEVRIQDVLDKRASYKNKSKTAQKCYQGFVEEGLFGVWHSWTTERRFHVGKKMLDLFYSMLTAENNGEELFNFKMDYVRNEDTGQSIGGFTVLTCNLPNPWGQMLHEEIEHFAEMRVIKKPTIIPPRPWGYVELSDEFVSDIGEAVKSNANFDGGYWSPDYQRVVIKRNRKNKASVKRQRKQAIPRVLEAINAMQDTPFRVNPKVLELQKHVFDEIDFNGEPIRLHHTTIDLNGRTPQFKIFPLINKIPPKDFLFPELQISEISDDVWKKLKRQAHERDGEARKVPRQNWKTIIDLADEMSAYRCFYFPWTMDWRTRAYPEPLLSPQGDDIGKSLLLFAQPKPIGKRGLEWLKFMVATLGEIDGIDKKSRAKRIKWTEDHLGLIHDIALRPFDNDVIKIWGSCDSRFQFYAACCELVDAINSPDPEKFQSGFPIAFDGSCSGIQHYAAMTLDKAAGRRVNLCYGDREDFYGYIAEQVNNRLSEILRDGGLSLQTFQLKATDPTTREQIIVREMSYGSASSEWKSFGVTRKLIKPNAMTFSYSATEQGMTDQIKKYVKDFYKTDLNADVEDVINLHQNEMCRWLVRIVREEIKKAAGKASMMMDWMVALVEAMHYYGLNPENNLTPNKVHNFEMGNQAVQWTTFDGMTMWQMVQKTDEPTRPEIKNPLREDTYLRGFYDELKTGKHYNPYLYKDSGLLDLQKNEAGIAPDVIHSQDATHLRMTVLDCKAKGVNHFWLVHDSFATVPADADVMYHSVRSEFKHLYTDFSLPEQLRNFAFNNLPEDKAVDLSNQLDSILDNDDPLDLNEILDSEFAFI